MIGSLVKFSSKKRDLYFPNASRYSHFNDQVGLVISHTINEKGEEHVRVKWVKPFKFVTRVFTVSDFNLLNFNVVSRA